MMFSPIFPWKAKALTETYTNKQIEINRIFLSRRHPIRFYAECPGTLGIATGSTVPATRQAFYLLAEAPFSRLLAMQDTYIAAALLSILSFAGCLFVKAGTGLNYLLITPFIFTAFTLIYCNQIYNSIIYINLINLG